MIQHKQSIDSEKIHKFKSITNHLWGDDDTKYDHVVDYLRNGNIPANLNNLNNLNNNNLNNFENNYSKKKYLFQRFANMYKLNEDNEIFITNVDIQKKLESKLVISEDKKYKVVRPSSKNEIIDNIVSGKNTLLTSLSATYIYDRILHNLSIINISLNYIKQYLLEKEHHIKAMKRNEKKQPIKSYRPRYPRQHWQMDTVHMQHKNMQSQNDKYEFFLLIIDIFSKYTYIRKIKTQSSKQVAEHLEEIFLAGDIPHVLQSDNGKEFQKEVILLCKKYNIQHRYTPSYSPQTNGFAENRNKLVKSMIYMHLVAKNKRLTLKKPTFRWIDSIKEIQYAINSIIHSVTKLTPLQVHFGINTHTFNISKDISLLPKRTVSFDNKENLTFDINKDRQYFKECKTDDSMFDDDENKLYLNTYIKKMKQTTINRTKDVKNKIATVADKREERVTNKLKLMRTQLKPGTFVKVFTYLKSSCCKVNMIDIHYKITLKNEKDIIIQEKTSSKLPGPFGVRTPQTKLNATEVQRSKWRERLYNNIFIIGESRRTPSGTESYILYKYNTDIGKTIKTHIIEKQESRRKDVWTKHFYAEQIMPIDSMDVHSMVRSNSNEIEQKLKIETNKEYKKAINNYEKNTNELSTQRIFTKQTENNFPGLNKNEYKNSKQKTTQLGTFLSNQIQLVLIQNTENDSNRINDEHITLKFDLNKNKKYNFFHDFSTELEFSKIESLCYKFKNQDNLLRRKGYLNNGEKSNLGIVCTYLYTDDELNANTTKNTEGELIKAIITSFHFKQFKKNSINLEHIENPFVLSFEFPRYKTDKNGIIILDKNKQKIIEYLVTTNKKPMKAKYCDFQEIIKIRWEWPFEDKSTNVNILYEKNKYNHSIQLLGKYVIIILNGVKTKGQLKGSSSKRRFFVKENNGGESHLNDFKNDMYRKYPQKHGEWCFQTNSGLEIVQQFNDWMIKTETM